MQLRVEGEGFLSVYLQVVPVVLGVPQMQGLWFGWMAFAVEVGRVWVRKLDWVWIPQQMSHW